MVKSAKTEGYDYITFSQERTVNGKIITSVKTVSLENTDNVESEFVRIFQFGKPDDKLEVITHKGKEPPMQPDPVAPKETSTKIPSTASYAVLGAVLAPDITKNFLDDITKALGLEQKQSYEEWQDYRSNWVTGLYSSQENQAKFTEAIAKGGSLEDIQKRIENTEFKETALDDVIGNYMAGIAPRNYGEGFIADDLQKTFFNPDSILYNPITGLGVISDRMNEAQESKRGDWYKFIPYYVATTLSDSAQMAILIPQARVDTISSRIGVSFARATLAVSPKSTTTAGIIASGSSKVARSGLNVLSNVGAGGTYKGKMVFTVEQILQSTELERKAYPLLDNLYKVISNTELKYVDSLRPSELDNVLGVRASDTLSESQKLDVAQRIYDANLAGALKTGNEIDQFLESVKRDFTQTPSNISGDVGFYRDPLSSLGANQKTLEQINILRQTDYKPIIDADDVIKTDTIFNRTPLSFSDDLTRTVMPSGYNFDSTPIEFGISGVNFPKTRIEVTDFKPRNRLKFNLVRGDMEYVADARIKKVKKGEDKIETTLYAVNQSTKPASNISIATSEDMSRLGLYYPSFNPFDFEIQNVPRLLTKQGNVIKGSEDIFYNSLGRSLGVQDKIDDYIRITSDITNVKNDIAKVEGKTDTKSVAKLSALNEKLSDLETQLSGNLGESTDDYINISLLVNTKNDLKSIDAQIKALSPNPKTKKRNYKKISQLQEIKKELEEKLPNYEIEGKRSFRSLYEQQLGNRYLNNYRSEGIESLLNDEIFASRLNISQEQRDEFALFLARQRNRDYVGTEDYYNIGRYVNTEEGKNLAQTALDAKIALRATGEIKEKTSKEFADSVNEYFKLKNEIAEIESKMNTEEFRDFSPAKLDAKKERLDDLILETYAKEIASYQERAGIDGYIQGRRYVTPQSIQPRIDELIARKTSVGEQILDTQQYIKELKPLINKENTNIAINKELLKDGVTPDTSFEGNIVKVYPEQITFHLRSLDIARATIAELEKKYAGKIPKVKKSQITKDRSIPRGFNVENVKKPTDPNTNTATKDYGYLDRDVSIEDIERDVYLNNWNGKDIDLTQLKRYLERAQGYDLDTKQVKRLFKNKEMPKTSFYDEAEIDSAIAEAEINLAGKDDKNMKAYIELLKELKQETKKPSAKSEALGEVSTSTKEGIEEAVSNIKKSRLLRESETSDAILYERAKRIENYNQNWLNKNLVGYKSYGRSGENLGRKYLQNYEELKNLESDIFQEKGRSNPIMTQGESEYLNLLRKDAFITDSQTKLGINLGRLRKEAGTLSEKINKLDDNIKYKLVSKNFKFFFTSALAETKQNLFNSRNIEGLETLRNIEGLRPESYSALETSISQLSSSDVRESNLLKVIKSKIDYKIQEEKKLIASTDTPNDYDADLKLKQNRLEADKERLRQINKDIKAYESENIRLENISNKLKKEINNSPDIQKYRQTLTPEEIDPAKSKLSTLGRNKDKYYYNLKNAESKIQILNKELSDIKSEESILRTRLLQTGGEPQIGDYASAVKMNLRKMETDTPTDLQKAIKRLESFEMISTGQDGTFDGISIDLLQADRSFTDKLNYGADEFTLGTTQYNTSSSPFDGIRKLLKMDTTKEEVAMSKVQREFADYDESLSGIVLDMSNVLESDKSNIKNFRKDVLNIVDDTKDDFTENAFANTSGTQLSTASVDRVLSRINNRLNIYTEIENKITNVKNDIAKIKNKTDTNNVEKLSKLNDQLVELETQLSNSRLNASGISSQEKNLLKQAKKGYTSIKNEIETVLTLADNKTKLKMELKETIKTRKNLDTESLLGKEGDKLLKKEQKITDEIDKIDFKIQEAMTNVANERKSVLERVLPPEQTSRMSKTQADYFKRLSKDISNQGDEKDTTSGKLLEESKNKNKDKKKKSEYESFNRYMNKLSTTDNTVNSQFLPIGIFPTVIRFPVNTPSDITAYAQPIEQPQIPQPSTNSFSDIDVQPMSKITPDINSITVAPEYKLPQLDITSSKIDTQLTPFQDVFSDSLSKLDTNITQINKQITNPIQDVTPKLATPELFKPVTYTKTITETPITPQGNKPPVPPMIPWLDIPYADRKRKKKERKTKSKKKKIYWDVPDQPFKPFNPKEYFTFRTEPRAVKRKEGRKNLD
jgi:hypothetical protein